MSKNRPRKRRNSPRIVAESLDTDELRDTVTTMIDTAHAIASRLEINLKELHDVLGPVLPLNAEAVAEADEEPPPGPKAVRQLHHLCDRMNAISRTLEVLARDAAV
ncbi:hypothetical protein [Burkholderia multivorans]|uniref:hypothetical protein n=1 Tax=Burkholderia multivorans TaxID=87883 RepID=UPI00158A25E4|nr:hypothetical protein [Burkholderia multivorans]